MNGMLISAKREFNYEYEERAFMRFMKILLVICVLIFVWSAYGHYKQINLSQNGISVLAKMQQTRFEKLHSNEYMVITLAGAFLSLLLMGVILEKKSIKNTKDL